MNWILDLYRTNPTAQAIAVLALVCVVGMSFGSIQFRGIKFGTAGVLFAGIVAGHFSKPIEVRTLEFVKEFGLILFVFCIGLQLGPGFFASLRQSGLRLNALACAIVVTGGLTAVAIGAFARLDGAAVLGIFSGASTNTPSLGAAQQALASLSGVSADRAALPALAYAVTYPAGIMGIISTLLILRWLFHIDVLREVEQHAAGQLISLERLQRRTLVVENPNFQGVRVDAARGLIASDVVVSRIRRTGTREVLAATGATELELGDSIVVVGTARGLDAFQRIVGRPDSEDITNLHGNVTGRQIIVTNADVLGKTFRELELESLYGVVVTRVTRGDLELTAVPTLRLRFGDVVQVVGPGEAIHRAAEQLGNSLQALNETQFVPFFAGITLGIILGTCPIAVPGLPQPLRLGLAAGPLLVAILVGRVGRIGRLVWHMPRNANLAFREFGIALFFASAGLIAGPTFFSTAFSSVGVLWLIAGLGVTVLPLLAVGMFARLKLGMNYVPLSGLLAGSMTDPPALAFANSICQSESPALAYAAVYPLTMLLRIVIVQTMAVLLCA